MLKDTLLSQHTNPNDNRVTSPPTVLISQTPGERDKGNHARPFHPIKLLYLHLWPIVLASVLRHKAISVGRHGCVQNRLMAIHRRAEILFGFFGCCQSAERKRVG
ncbi:hypothetical protein CDAR_207681 [Caerostris darwini]|uniref:Uncharacterized protein n=1 Tax=Caerostris darwini TaxID=1538125 RepID=A0AAV4WSU1_9ARAC|nr:hypothetical protein CDAR_207681 [Caerostris darwini]